MLPTLIILIFTVVIIFTVIPYAFMSVIRQMEAAQVRPVTGCRAQRNIFCITLLANYILRESMYCNDWSVPSTFISLLCPGLSTMLSTGFKDAGTDCLFCSGSGECQDGGGQHECQSV